MKKLLIFIFASVLGGTLALGGYLYFFEPENQQTVYEPGEDSYVGSQKITTHFVTQDSNAGIAANPDFTAAAEKTIHAVVHVKNVEVVDAPRNISEYLRGVRGGKYIRGMGSGVIITPDGYIVTNNHVIEGASELEVTLSNNKTYTARVIGKSPQEDIALIKIDEDNLDYLPFGDSNSAKIGQWVLAVGNPFNLTSTVTAGIISAKGRNLDEGGTQMQSYIQTDAAINPGNSGGALVNTNGELIGINAAITSRTGNYIGYSFAIPSNNARKIVEDIMEYGNVKQAILGIMGSTMNPEKAQMDGLSLSQGVLVASTSDGALKAGMKKGDVITDIDGVKIRKMSDLSSYIRTKRPNEKVKVAFVRNGKKQNATVQLTEYETYVMVFDEADLEVANADPSYLRNFNAEGGVKIAQTTSSILQIPMDYFIIVGIDGQPVRSVKDVREIMEQKGRGESTHVTFQSRRGQRETVVF